MYKELTIAKQTPAYRVDPHQGVGIDGSPAYRAVGLELIATSKHPAPVDTPPAKETFDHSLLRLMLDEVDYGMLLLSRSGDVMHANLSARKQLGAHQPLQQVGQRLRAQSAEGERVLRQALESASQAHRRCLMTLGNGEQRVMVAVVPLGPSTQRQAVASPGFGEQQGAILLVLGKNDVCQALSIQWFAQQHCLTSAEGRVLLALCNGADPDDVAAEQGVALSTVRTQIGSIRGKTGANSLRALVRQVALLPPLLSALR
jgi:DNA-binding CsgD family transcriptional regulator